jgi:hypothetical protein
MWRRPRPQHGVAGSFERLVGDLDPIERVFREAAGLGQNGDDRLPDVADFSARRRIKVIA